MKWKNLNPVTWVSNGLNKALDKVSPGERGIKPPYPGFNWEDCIQALQSNPGMNAQDFAAVMGYSTNGTGDPATNPYIVNYRAAAEQEVNRRKLTIVQAQQSQQGATLPVPVQSVSPVVVTPDDDQGKPAIPVQGQFIDQSEQDARMLSIITAAGQKTEQFRKEAEGFDDEKAPGGEKVLRFVFSAFAYIIPSLLALVVGMAVGDAFTPAKSTLFYIWYAHLLSVAMEASLPIMGFVSALTFRRAAKDRSQVAVCAVAALFFLALGVGNAVVQIFMVTQNIGALTSSDQAAVIFRACAPLIVDTICSFYLAVTGAKSLKRYLADKRAVIEAVRDISGINILLESQQQTAALNEMQALMDMQSKQKRAQTWNKIEAIQAEKMVKQAEKAMNDDDDDSGSYRRRRY